jgi:hypothetical protein
MPFHLLKRHSRRYANYRTADDVPTPTYFTQQPLTLRAMNTFSNEVLHEDFKVDLNAEAEVYLDLILATIVFRTPDLEDMVIERFRQWMRRKQVRVQDVAYANRQMAKLGNQNKDFFRARKLRMVMATMLVGANSSIDAKLARFEALTDRRAMLQLRTDIATAKRLSDMGQVMT